MPKVWNIHDRNCPKDAIYIGKANWWYRLEESKYANPLRICIERNRDEACVMFEYYANVKFSDAEVRADLGGKDVKCWCAPKRCHGEYLVRRANRNQ